MKRVLLLMASRTYKAGAFLRAAGKLPCAAVVGTDRQQVLSSLDPAGNLLLPFHDVPHAVQRILQHHAQYPIDAILATDDEGVVIAAAANEALGLPANPVQSVIDATDKQRTRQAFAAAGLPSPAFREVHNTEESVDAAEVIGYPCVVKPLHLSASRGVMRVNDRAELEAACRRLQTILATDASAGFAIAADRSTDGWLVEAYIPGREFALEGVLADGALHTLAIFDKPDPLEGPFFQETLYVTPSRLPQQRQEAVQKMVHRAVQALHLREGPIHAEVRCSGDTVTVLEVAPRSIGGRCSTALRFGDDATHSLEEILLAQALQLENAVRPREPSASGVLMIPIANAGTLREVGGTDEAQAVPGVTGVEITIPIGQAMQPPPDGWQYLGFVFARARTPEGVEQALRTAHSRLQIVIDSARSFGSHTQQQWSAEENHDRSNQ